MKKISFWHVLTALVVIAIVKYYVAVYIVIPTAQTYFVGGIQR